jgi:hypothetical protein
MKRSTYTFTLNGKTYTTDQQTLTVLRSIVPSAHETGDSSAVMAVMRLGTSTGRITEITSNDQGPAHDA